MGQTCKILLPELNISTAGHIVNFGPKMPDRGKFRLRKDTSSKSMAVSACTRGVQWLHRAGSSLFNYASQTLTTKFKHTIAQARRELSVYMGHLFEDITILSTQIRHSSDIRYVMFLRYME